MKPETITRLVQLFVTAPIMMRRSKQQKNKYFKNALGVAGAAIAIMSLYQLLDAKQKKVAEKNKQTDIAVKKLIIKSGEARYGK